MEQNLSETEQKANDVNAAWYKLNSLIDTEDKDIFEAMSNLLGEIVLLSDMVFADNQEIVGFTEDELQD